MENPASDAQDWPLAAGGDHGAFERVFNRHADLIYRFARRRTGDEDLAEEVVAQVFLEAWRQRTRVQLMNGSLRSWLLGVASNLVRRHWRQRERRNRAIGRLPRAVSAADHADEVAERFDGQRRLVAVQERLAGMPRAQVEVLLLWAWEELSYEEIAAVVGVPVGTVRSRLSRARTRLNGPEGTAVRNRAFPDRRDATEDDPPATDLGRSTG